MSAAAPASLAAFVAASALVIVVPGPATLFVLEQARASRAHAVRAVLGLAVGDLLLITAAGLGLAALLREWPTLLAALRVGGAAYVAWLGVAGLLRPARGGAEAGVRSAGRGSFASALLLTLANPKVLLFFGAFFPLFIAAGQGPWLLAFWRLGLVFEAINLAWFALLIAGFAALRRRLPASAQGVFGRLGGLALIACAALVLLG